MIRGKTTIRGSRGVLMVSRILVLVLFSVLILGMGLVTPREIHAETVRISYAGISGYNVPLWVAD
jgi:hypothetical protein